MAKLSASEVAKLLTELGQRTTLAGGNPYRGRAYARAAEALASLTAPLETIIEQGRLRELPGVGEAIADIIVKLHRAGTHPKLETMRAEVPAGVLEMLSVPGLRPERIARLHNEFGISSLAELEEAARNNKLAQVKGLGPALQGKILEGLEIRRKSGGARHLHKAAALLEAAQRQVEGSGLGLTRITAAGDFRRCCEIASDLALVAEAPALKDGPQVLKEGDLALHLTDAKRFGITLLLATGSAAHIRDLRALAQIEGLTLGPDGVRRGKKLVASKTEADVYSALGLSFIPPELREGRGEIVLAKAHRLPKLVEEEDIEGILHAHTVASDGVNSLEEMAEATRERGYSYFGVADHSQSARYAGGLSVDEVTEQHRDIDRLNAAYRGRFRVFKGIEADILPDGRLDYSDEVLRSFEFVVASVHGQFRMDRKRQTERVLRAVANPFTTILGHMTGRQLLRRKGLDLDVEKVLRACADHGVAIEINANPWRLDLDWQWHARALELGCRFSINPDAHSTAELDLMRWGIGIARKGGIPKERVLNCLDREAFTEFLKLRRSRSSRKTATSSRA